MRGRLSGPVLPCSGPSRPIGVGACREGGLRASVWQGPDASRGPKGGFGLQHFCSVGNGWLAVCSESQRAATCPGGSRPRCVARCMPRACCVWRHEGARPLCVTSCVASVCRPWARHRRSPPHQRPLQPPVPCCCGCGGGCTSGGSPCCSGSHSVLPALLLSPGVPPQLLVAPLPSSMPPCPGSRSGSPSALSMAEARPCSDRTSLHARRAAASGGRGGDCSPGRAAAAPKALPAAASSPADSSPDDACPQQHL